MASAAVLGLGATAALIPASAASAKSKVNVFTMKGSYNGTVTVNKNKCVILNGVLTGPDAYSISLNKLKIAIAGLAMKSGSLSIQAPKAGTYKFAHVSPTANKAARITSLDGTEGSFSETSGTFTMKGNKGSLNLVMEYEGPPSITSSTQPSFSGSETVTGSWSCTPGSAGDLS